MLLDLEDNRPQENMIEMDVLRLCLSTDVCKALNMSFLDLMKLDLPTYNLIKDKIVEETKARVATSEEMTKKMEKSSKQLKDRILNGQ